MHMTVALPMLSFPVIVACDGSDPRYDVVVNSNTEVEQADLEQTDAYLRAFDEDVDFLIQESFPPVGPRAPTIDKDASAYCLTIVGKLEAQPYIDTSDVRSNRYTKGYAARAPGRGIIVVEVRPP